MMGNEQGKVLSEFLLVAPLVDTVLSCNIVVLCHDNHIVFYNKDGKQIAQVKDQRITGCWNVCLVYDKGILVTTEKDQIHLWRVV
jgi:hypothetical protein